MDSVKLRSTSNLHWPPMCPICNCKATDTAETSITHTKDPKYYVVAFGWTNEKYSLKFPVCRKHKLLCKIIDLPASMGSINGFLFFIFAPLVIWVGLSLLISFITPVKDLGFGNIFNWLGGIIYIAFFCFFIIASILKPVKIINLNEGFLNLRIRNSNILKIFKSLNAEKIVN
jgi:uncharacterized integral membrane protein